MLLSDVLGISSAVDVANDLDPAATPGTVLGPYYVPDSPRRALGSSLIDTDDGGERLHVSGTVRDVEGIRSPMPRSTSGDARRTDSTLRRIRHRRRPTCVD